MICVYYLIGFIITLFGGYMHGYATKRLVVVKKDSVSIEIYNNIDSRNSERQLYYLFQATFWPAMFMFWILSYISMLLLNIARFIIHNVWIPCTYKIYKLFARTVK